MIDFSSTLKLLKISRWAASAFLVLSFGVAQSSAFGGSHPAANQTGDGDPKAQFKGLDDAQVSKLSDKEVLKLQAEKRDSIDRLEKTAAEIARKWRARQAQDRAANGGQPQPQPPGPKIDGANESKNMTDSQVKNQTDQSGQEPSGPNPLQPLDAAPSADSVGDSNGNSEMANTPDAGMESKNENLPEADVQVDPSVRGASVSSVVNGPIDRLALGTSLYATDQFRECLKILEAVELRPLSVEDRQWHDYLAASCYRKLGDRSEAEDHYRSVLQRSTSTWVSTAARWWLEHTDEKSQLELKLEQVQTTVGNWRKEIDVLKSAN